MGMSSFRSSSQFSEMTRTIVEDYTSADFGNDEYCQVWYVGEEEEEAPSIPNSNRLITPAQYLIRIDPFNSEIDEDDALWDRTDNRYEWQPDDLTFVPNEAGYYVIKLTVTEPSMPGYSVSAYQVIDVRNPIDTLPDATYWLENNVAAVVLFCISGVLLIALVALFVIKPRQSVDEVDVKSLKGSKKSKTDEEKKD